MKHNNEASERAFKILKQARKNKEPVRLGEEWQCQVMQRIHAVGPVAAPKHLWEAFGDVVWRLAPATCVLTLVLGLCTVSVDFAPEYEMARLYLGNPVEFLLIESLGI